MTRGGSSRTLFLGLLMFGAGYLWSSCLTEISFLTEYRNNDAVTGSKNLTASPDDDIQRSQSELTLDTTKSLETPANTSTVAAAAEYLGIDQVYVNLLEEAKRRSEADFATSHTKSKRGVVIGPVEGNFKRHALRGT